LEGKESASEWAVHGGVIFGGDGESPGRKAAARMTPLM
jgi:hypothetical protein